MTTLHIFIKIISVVLFIGFIIINKFGIWEFFSYLFLLLLVAKLSKINIIYLLSRACISLISIIFLFPILLFPNVDIAVKLNFYIEVIAKLYLITGALIFLFKTSKIENILYVLQILKMPKAILTCTLYVFYFFFSLIDEFSKIIRAQEVRGKKSKVGFYIVWSQINKTLLPRVFRRRKMIYQVMEARGYNGEIETLGEYKIHFTDILFFIIFLIILILIKLL